METMRQRHPESVVTPPPGETSQPSPIGLLSFNSSTCPGRLMLLTTTLQYLCTDCNPIINISACPGRLMLLTRNTTLSSELRSCVKVEVDVRGSRP